jgi:DNA-binding LacI/PurR family transcriptional regulator
MTNPRPAQVTLNTVAQLAGVSRSTASRVLTGHPSVSPEGKRAVERAVRRLDYVPSQAGRALAMGRSDAVVMVIFESTTFLFGDTFLGRLVRGVDEVLAQRDRQLVLLASHAGSEPNRLDRYLAGSHAEGVLMVSHHGSHPLPGRLAARGIPVVFGGRPPDPDHFSYVDVDNLGGAFAAVSHLASGGRRTIATITGPQDMPAGHDRILGWRSALAVAHLAADDDLAEPGDFTREGGIRAMRILLQRRPRLDAVFVASDTMARGALEVLAGAGRQVPEDVAVVGFNDDPMAETTYPALSSVRQPVEEMGREMVRLLVDLIRNPHHAHRRVLLSTQLQVRRSSVRPGQAGTGVNEGSRIEAIHPDVDRQVTRAPRDGQALLHR